MSTESAPLLGAVGLLERAAGYARAGLALVTDERLTLPTPCHGWDVQALLAHVDDSVAALAEAAGEGTVSLETTGTGVVEVIRARVCALLSAWTRTDGHPPVLVGDCRMDTPLLGATGALEIAVHAWDLARACGQRRPLPPELADELLDLAPLLVTGADRPGRFAPPVAVSPLAPPGDRLLAFLGRQP